MAEGKDVIEELEKEITCAICHDHYTEPKVLPCCHYYCKQCLHSLALRTGLDRPFSCPECRNSTILPQRSADNLPSAFTVNRLKDMHSKLERAHGKVEAKCEMCVEGGKAEAFCRQCAQFVCNDCVNHHQKMKLSADHKIASFDELIQDIQAKKFFLSESYLQKCTVHEQPMNMYCFDCKTLICRDCTIKTHNSQTHNYEFIKVAAPQMKKDLIQQLDPLKETKETLSHAVKEVQTTKSEVEVQGKSVKQHIHSSSDELIKIIEHRKQELLAEATEMIRNKLANLSSQEERLSTEGAAVQSVIEYTEQCVEHSTDNEIIQTYNELQSKINEFGDKSNGLLKVDTIDAEHFSVEITCAEELKQLCLEKMKIKLKHPMLNVTGDGMKLAQVDKISEIALTIGGVSGEPVQCQLKSLVDGSITNCKVTRSQANEYRIQYTPTVRGRHELTVTVNEQEVAGSPFPVHVSIHPTQLGKPVRVINDNQHPWDIAMNSKGETIVTFYYHSIVVFDKSGKRVRSFQTTSCNIADLWAMTLDSNDCIFITGNLSDKKSHKIIKLSPDFKIINEISIDGEINFIGLEVIGDELMTCNSKHGCITVYTTDLKYVRRIGSRGDSPGQFQDICSVSSDEHGNLYVGDPIQSCVLVFDVAGKFIRSFGIKEHDENNLRLPFFMCVSGQYVYVADYHNHKVLVFTTEGAYVTSFGQRGGSEGDFEYPWGLYVDVDGFVHISDYNKRSQIF